MLHVNLKRLPPRTTTSDCGVKLTRKPGPYGFPVYSLEEMSYGQFGVLRALLAQSEGGVSLIEAIDKIIEG